MPPSPFGFEIIGDRPHQRIADRVDREGDRYGESAETPREAKYRVVVKENEEAEREGLEAFGDLSESKCVAR